MPEAVLIDQAFGETRLAILDADHKLSDLFFFRAEAPSPVGDIHLARVRAAAPALDGVFLALGEGSEAFLKGQKRKLPHEGAALIVQIRGEPGGGKLPIATTDIRRSPPLEARWPEIEELARRSEAPALLHRDPVPWLAPLHTLSAATPILTDSREILAALKSLLAAGWLAGAAERLVFEQRSLFASHGVEDEISTLYGPRVPLGRGAAITIERTQALTAIDVDAGGAGSGRDQGATARSVNARAASEIARQLRLRRIGGLVVIDFLRGNAGDRHGVRAALETALRPDPTPSDISGFTRFGLFELTRPRRARPLAQDINDPRHPGAPNNPTAARIAFRAALAASAEAPGRPLTLACAPALARWIAEAGPGTTNFAELFTKESGAPLLLTADPGLEPAAFSVYHRPQGSV